MALRVGLGRLLAEQSGVALDLLVIDEGGFGALDDAGQEALGAGIAGMGRLFDVLLLVTHLDELADVLPQRLTVSRGPDGTAQMMAM